MAFRVHWWCRQRFWLISITKAFWSWWKSRISFPATRFFWQDLPQPDRSVKSIRRSQPAKWMWSSVLMPWSRKRWNIRIWVLWSQMSSTDSAFARGKRWRPEEIRHMYLLWVQPLFPGHWRSFYTEIWIFRSSMSFLQKGFRSKIA